MLMDTALVAYAERAGIVLLDDNEQWANRMQIRSETSNRLYVVAQNKRTGVWACNCPGHKRARNGIRKCKHITSMAGFLAQVEKPAVQGGTR
jgi:hypothetical protein